MASAGCGRGGRDRAPGGAPEGPTHEELLEREQECTAEKRRGRRRLREEKKKTPQEKAQGRVQQKLRRPQQAPLKV